MATQPDDPTEVNMTSVVSVPQASWAGIVGGNKNEKCNNKETIVVNSKDIDVMSENSEEPINEAANPEGVAEDEQNFADFIEIKSKNKTKKRDQQKIRKLKNNKRFFYEKQEFADKSKDMQHGKNVKDSVCVKPGSVVTIEGNPDSTEENQQVGDETKEEKCFIPAPVPAVNPWSKRKVDPEDIKNAADFPVIGMYFIK